jgi:hypothetical protein
MADTVLWSIVTSGLWMARVLQILLNHRSRAFGGMYKTAIWLRAVEELLSLIAYVPGMLGHIPDRASLSSSGIFIILPSLVQAWQAWVLPVAKSKEEEEDAK